MNTDEHRLNGLTEKVIGAAFEVSNVLGPGFLEKVYERALLKELRLRGLDAECQVGIEVFYKDQLVGEYLADIVVANTIIVKLKCVGSLSKEHLAQCMNYLKASGKKIALLLNFQRPRLELRRIIN